MLVCCTFFELTGAASSSKIDIQRVTGGSGSQTAVYLGWPGPSSAPDPLEMDLQRSCTDKNAAVQVLLYRPQGTWNG